MPLHRSRQALLRSSREFSLVPLPPCFRPHSASPAGGRPRSGPSQLAMLRTHSLLLLATAPASPCALQSFLLLLPVAAMAPWRFASHVGTAPAWALRTPRRSCALMLVTYPSAHEHALCAHAMWHFIAPAAPLRSPPFFASAMLLGACMCNPECRPAPACGLRTSQCCRGSFLAACPSAHHNAASQQSRK